jgi:transcriptional regulator with XRE-family HTH domain
MTEKKEFLCFSHTECFGLVVRWERQNLNLSQLEFARKAGIDLMTLSMIEHGNIAPTLTMIRILADNFGVADTMLLAGAERVLKAIHEMDPKAIHYPERHEKGFFPGALFWEQRLLDNVREKALK